MSDNDTFRVRRYTGPEPPSPSVLAALRCGRRDAACHVVPIWAQSCKIIAHTRTFEELLAEAREMAARDRIAAAEAKEFWNRVARGEDPKVVPFRRRYRPWHK